MDETLFWISITACVVGAILGAWHAVHNDKKNN